MKNQIPKIILLLAVLFSVAGCELVGDIFEAGMSVGIFLVILIIAIIVWIISRFRK
jgi:hypothetical protein